MRTSSPRSKPSSISNCVVLMMSATRTTGVLTRFNERVGQTSVFIKEPYYHYYHRVFPYESALAMTAYNLIITINLSRNRTQSS